MSKKTFTLHTKVTDVKTFNIRQNGLQKITKKDKTEIYVDPFRTIPLFITTDTTGHHHIFSDFSTFYALKNIDKTIDKTGYWQNILMGGCVHTRTLYKNTKQLPGAHKLIVNHTDNTYKIDRYWDFSVQKDPTITKEKMLEGMFTRLDAMAKKFADNAQKSNTHYTLGMSGGMDCRLLIAFLSRHLKTDALTPFTFGFDERILEYQYAKEVAHTCGFTNTLFHKLDASSYRNALTHMPQQSGGQIGINHCHILDFLKTNAQQNLLPKNTQHISTYYTDAILGWDARYPKNIPTNLADNFYTHVTQAYPFLPEKVKEEMIQDGLNVFTPVVKPTTNMSCLPEYKYVTERHQKFHLHLAYMQGHHMPMHIPFADYDLLTYALSVPAQFRANKHWVDDIFAQYFPKIAKIKDVSSRFQWGANYSSKREWAHFKALNAANSIIRPLSGGRTELYNPYQTEEADRILRRHFHTDLKSATQKAVLHGLMDTKTKHMFDKLPWRSRGISERLNLISNAALLD